MMSQGVKRDSKWRTDSPAYPFLYLIQQIQVATRNTSPDMAAVFHAWPCSRFIEIQNNLRRKKLHRTNQSSNFLGGSFSDRDNKRPPVQEKLNPTILKNDFSSRTDPSIFTWIAPVLLDWLNETSWVFPALQSIVPRRSDSSSEANSSWWSVDWF